MTLWKWSRTAATNATADSTCPFPEGMNPGALNDGTRGMMAAAAKYRDDISGLLLTGGTGSAYSIATNQTFDSLPHLDGAMIAFTAHTGNSGACTLNVDGQGAKPLRIAPGIDLPSGTLVAGTPYVATYYNTASEYILQGGAGGPYSIPIGGLVPYTGGTAPSSNLMIPLGQGISRATYSAYFSLVGTSYGSGDGSTTFNVPNYGNRVLAQAGTGGGGTISIAQFVGESTHALSVGELPFLNPQFVGSPGAVNVASATSTIAYGLVPSGTGGGDFLFNGVNGNAQISSSGTFTPVGSIVPFGGGAAHNVTQPTAGVNFLLRII